MGGALMVTFVGYRLTFLRQEPLFGDKFKLPTAGGIDTRLLVGSAVFGVGWGVAGFCPGGALPALGTGRVDVLIFVAALVLGILGARAFSSRSPVSHPAHEMKGTKQ